MVSWFRLFGSLVLLNALVCGLLVWENAAVRASGGRDISALLVWSLVPLPVGLGLLFHRRWAAVLFSAGCLGLGGWLIVGSLLHVPWPGLAINIAFGLLALIPAYITLRNWRQLQS